VKSNEPGKPDLLTGHPEPSDMLAAIIVIVTGK
jgi:hypothetical protein